MAQCLEPWPWVLMHKMYVAYLVTTADSPLDEIHLTHIVIHEAGRADRCRPLLTCEPPTKLHNAFDGWPLFDECKCRVNGEHGSWYRVGVQHEAAQACSR